MVADLKPNPACGEALVTVRHLYAHGVDVRGNCVVGLFGERFALENAAGERLCAGELGRFVLPTFVFPGFVFANFFLANPVVLGASVANGDTHGAHGKLDCGTCWRVADSVACEVDDDLADFRLRSVDSWNGFSISAVQGDETDVAVGCLCGCVGSRVADNGAEVDPTGLDLSPFVEAGQSDQVFNEDSHAFGFGFDSAHCLANHFGVLNCALPVQFGVPANGDKWSPQFVGGI